MQHKDVITTFYELQKKYNCTILSRYDEISRTMVIRATINCGPTYNVELRIPEDELVSRTLGSGIEEEVCLFIDRSLNNFFDNNPVRLANSLPIDADDDVRRVYEELIRGNTVVSIYPIGGISHEKR